MKPHSLLCSLLAFLAISTTAMGLTTVDFTTLGSDSVDITTATNPEGLTLNGVTLTYDDLGSGVDTASVSATGVYGSTSGSLILTFSAPVTQVNFDFSILGVFAAAADGVTMTFKNAGADVTDQIIEAGTFTPYDPLDPALGGDAFGSVAFTGAAFDQVLMFFSLDGQHFTLANLSYEPVASGGGGGGGGGGSGGQVDPAQDTKTTDGNGGATLAVVLGGAQGQVVVASAPSGVAVTARLAAASGHDFAGIGSGGDDAMPGTLSVQSALAAGTFKATIQICYTDSALTAAGLSASEIAMHTWNVASNAWVLAGTRNVGQSAPTGNVGDYGWNGNCIWVVVNHFSDFVGADACPNDPNKSSPGVCGCGVPDTDSDGDGTPDCNDQCPQDANKTAPGACGCGVVDVDLDGDGIADCHDQCPQDPAKTAPGVCGCGVADTDSDGDGVPNCIDQCPGTPAGTEVDATGCPVTSSTGAPVPTTPTAMCGAGLVEAMMVSLLGLTLLRTGRRHRIC